MHNKTLVMILFLLFIGPGSLALAGPDRQPFTEIWNKIDELEQRIEELENGTAKYTINFEGCLIYDNSEGEINYQNGANYSKTLIWNCADFGNYGDQHIELFFTSKDGQCFRGPSQYISEGICNAPYVAPENPVFDAEITDFQTGQYVEEECHGIYGQYCDYYYYYTYTSKVTNVGNATLFNLKINNSNYSVIPVGATVTESGSGYAGYNITQPVTKTVSVEVKMWDGTVIDSQTKTIIINP